MKNIDWFSSGLIIYDLFPQQSTFATFFYIPYTFMFHLCDIMFNNKKYTR